MTTTQAPTTTAPLRPQDFTYNYGQKAVPNRWTPGLIDVISRTLGDTPVMVEIGGLMWLGRLAGARPYAHDAGRLRFVHGPEQITAYDLNEVGYIVPLTTPEAKPHGGPQGWRWIIADVLRQESHEAGDRVWEHWTIRDTDGSDSSARTPYGKRRITPETGGAWTVHFTPQATPAQVEAWNAGTSDRAGRYYAMPETIVRIDRDGKTSVKFQASEVRCG